MSFLYRPTPVVVLGGKTVGSDHVPLQRLPAGVMHGYDPNSNWKVLNNFGRRTLRGNPWIVSSGTMGSFLGDDSSGFDFTSVPLPSPAVLSPDFSVFQPTVPIDTTSVDITGGLTLPPISQLPQIAPIVTPTLDLSAQNSPITGGLVAPPSVTPISISSQGVVAQASIPATGIAAVFTAIGNLFKPKASVTPMTAAMPGVYSATTVAPSWFNQATLISGVSNSTVVVGGLAGMLALLVLFEDIEEPEHEHGRKR